MELVNIKTKNISTPTSIEITILLILLMTLKTRKFDGKKSYTEYLNNPVPNTFVFDLCDASEVDAIIIQLSITKASGPNGKYYR